MIEFVDGKKFIDGYAPSVYRHGVMTGAMEYMHESWVPDDWDGESDPPVPTSPWTDREGRVWTKRGEHTWFPSILSPEEVANAL